MLCLLGLASEQVIVCVFRGGGGSFADGGAQGMGFTKDPKTRELQELLEQVLSCHGVTLCEQTLLDTPNVWHTRTHTRKHT